MVGTERLHLWRRNVSKVLIDHAAMSFDPLGFVARFEFWPPNLATSSFGV